MDLYIIRHGQRADHLEGYQGGKNPPLSELGHKQARCVAERVAQLRPDALYCSSMRRALQTAEPSAEATGLPVHVWPMLCETTRVTGSERAARDPGWAQKTVVWTGADEPAETETDEDSYAAGEGNYYLLSEIPGLYPHAILDQPFPWPDAWKSALKHRTIETCYARIELAAQALLDRHAPEDVVVLLIHGNCGELLMHCLLDIPLPGNSRTRPRRFASQTASLAHVNIDAEGGARLWAVNCVAHLPEALRFGS